MVCYERGADIAYRAQWQLTGSSSMIRHNPDYKFSP